jgi:hypothetical protein
MRQGQALLREHEVFVWHAGPTRRCHTMVMGWAADGGKWTKRGYLAQSRDFPFSLFFPIFQIFKLNSNIQTEFKYLFWTSDFQLG